MVCISLKSWAWYPWKAKEQNSYSGDDQQRQTWTARKGGCLCKLASSSQEVSPIRRSGQKFVASRKQQISNKACLSTEFIRHGVVIAQNTVHPFLAFFSLEMTCSLSITRKIIFFSRKVSTCAYNSTLRVNYSSAKKISPDICIIFINWADHWMSFVPQSNLEGIPIFAWTLHPLCFLLR